MKRSLIFQFCFLQLCFFSLFASDFGTVQAKNAILINADLGSVLFEKEADERIFPASLTKVAVTLFVLENFQHDLNQVFEAKKEHLEIVTPYEKKQLFHTLPPHILETDGTMIHLRVGERMTLYQLLEGVMICSGNDASNVVAGTLYGSIEDFMCALNHYLKQIGCKETQLLNPHGLSHPEHYSTARDLALIAKRAMQHPVFREIVAKNKFYRPATNLQPAKTMYVGNRLLKRGRYYYSKAIGIKTGNTLAAGSCLITAAQDHGKTYIAVLLGYNDQISRYQDAVKLMEGAFHTKPIDRKYVKAGLIDETIQLKGAKQPIQGYLKQDLSFALLPEEQLDCDIQYSYDAPNFPIQKNEQIGKVLVFSKSGEKLHEHPIFAAVKVNEALFHKFQRVFQSIYEKIAMHTNIWAVVLIVGLIFFLGLRRFFHLQ